jgi:hypothetical protein
MSDVKTKEQEAQEKFVEENKKQIAEFLEKTKAKFDLPLEVDEKGNLTIKDGFCAFFFKNGIPEKPVFFGNVDTDYLPILCKKVEAGQKQMRLANKVNALPAETKAFFETE